MADIRTQDFALTDGTTLDDVLETFDFIDDWDERYRYLIELGRKLPALEDAERNEDSKVRGCQSQVWMVNRDSNGQHLLLVGDSDAHIVRGLVALLLLIYSGKTRDEARHIDAKSILEGLDLARHLSPMRANGLYAMLERIGQMSRE